MATQRRIRRFSLLSILSLSLLLASCGGGGGGGDAAVKPPAGTTPDAGGIVSGTPSSPPPSSTGTLPPAGTGTPGTGTPGTGTPGTGTGTGDGTTGTGPGTGTAIDNSFRVSISSPELVFQGEESAVLGSATVVGTGSGTYPGTIYTGSVDLGTSLDRVLVETTDSTVNFRVFPKWNLPAGEYRGSLQLFACPDARCAKHFAGSPVTIPYTIKVTKSFKVTLGQASLSSLSGQTGSGTVVVDLPAGVSHYTAVASAPWLTVSDITSTGFKITGQPMPPGTYFADITVTAGGRSKTMGVSYTVSGDASTITRIIPSVDNIDLASYIQGTARSTFSVTLPSWSKTLDTRLTYYGEGTDWLELVKTEEGRYTLTASAATLPPGRYGATLELTSGPMAVPVLLPISFTVGAPSWRLTGNTLFNVSATTTAAALGSTMQVELPQIAAQQWTASTNSRWLKLANTSGTTGTGSLRVSVDAAELLALDNFASHSAEVALTTGDSRIASTTLTFTLNKALPETHFVSPQTRLPGEGGTYTLRGRGFDAIPDLKAGLKITGATPQELIRVSDTEVRVRLAGAAAGAVGFTTPNALGAATGSPALEVVPQGVFAYSAIPTAGNKSNLVFDAKRQALYAANKTMHSVMRYAYTGSTWEVSSAPLSSVDSVALSPDGKTLVATSTTSGIVLLDPATLKIQGTYGGVTVGGDTLNSLPGLAITNDGRAYFKGGYYDSLNYFDLVSRKFGAVGNRANYSFHDGPWFSIAGDGSRLNIVQSAGVSPSPQMLYLDSADGMPKQNPAGMTFWYEAAQSLRGERFVEGTYRVYDRDFAVMGDLALAGSDYFGRTPVVSPDGSRVYVMAYSSASLRGGPGTPRVYVFDSSQRMVVTTNLPLLGYFDLAHFPTCNNTEYACNTRATGAISPDGKTLFFLGDAHLVVAPIPQTLNTVQRASLQRAAGAAPKLEAVRLGR